ncbi:hypothetical protein BKA70DRAFT_1218358 [Coprinopsis sp. MPI-PUGE-AT-0042]|nr:hypothetical protein BKA70DRAFT_1218358 [Coprinopsis sp. MPI-PUGE-AT-0042]
MYEFLLVTVLVPRLYAALGYLMDPSLGPWIYDSKRSYNPDPPSTFAGDYKLPGSSFPFPPWSSWHCGWRKARGFSTSKCRRHRACKAYSGSILIWTVEATYEHANKRPVLSSLTNYTRSLWAFETMSECRRPQGLDHHGKGKGDQIQDVSRAATSPYLYAVTSLVASCAQFQNTVALLSEYTRALLGDD